MATTHLGLVVYGCVVAAILRSQGVASAPIEGEVANVKTNQNGDLEQQLMQQSGENKSSQPSSSVNHGAAAVDPADPRGQGSDDVDSDDDDDVEATGLSSDYYGEVTQLERLNDQLREEDGIEDIPAAAAAGPEEEEEEEEGEEDRNSNGQLQDEEMNNGRRNKEGYNINFQARSVEDDAEKIETEENKNRAFRIEDDVEQMERPWEDVNDFESQEAPPSGGSAAVAEKKEIRNNDDDEDVHENGRDDETTDQPKEKEEEDGEEEGEGEGEGERTKIDRQNIEQLRYTEDGQRNTAETFDSRLLISREKKTLQGKWRAPELDKPDMQRDDESRLGYVDDGFNGEEVYM